MNPSPQRLIAVILLAALVAIVVILVREPAATAPLEFGADGYELLAETTPPNDDAAPEPDRRLPASEQPAAVIRGNRGTAAGGSQAAELRGQLLRADGQPVVRATIGLQIDGPGPQRLRLRRTAMTDDTGRFALRGPLPEGFDQLVFAIRSPGQDLAPFLHVLPATSLTAGHADLGVLHPPAAATLTGQVRSSGARLTSAAPWLARLRPAPGNTLDDWRSWSELVPPARVDPETSSYHLTGLPPGPWRLAVSGDDILEARLAEVLELRAGAPHTAPDLWVEFGVRLAGHVVAAADGAPVADAEVRVQPLRPTAGAAPVRHRTRTDRDGAFALPTVPDVGQQLVVEAPGFQTLRHVVLQPRAADNVQLRLSPALVVTVQALDAHTGDPVEHFAAGVRAAPLDPAAGPVRRTIPSDLPAPGFHPQGIVELGDLQPGRDLQVIVLAPDHQPCWTAPFDLLADGPSPTLAVELIPARPILGMVIGVEGSTEIPLADAFLVLRDQNGTRGPTVLGSTRSGPDGRFTFPGIADGEVSIEASADGWSSTLLQVQVGALQSKIDAPLRINLQRPAGLEGALAPVPSRALRVLAWSPRHGLRTTLSDAETGRYRFEALPPGPWLLTAGAGQPGELLFAGIGNRLDGAGRPHRFDTELRPGTATELALQIEETPRSGVLGTVRGSQGRPAAGHSVRLLGRSVPPASELVTPDRGLPAPPSHATRSAADGSYSFTAVLAGRYLLRVDARPGYPQVEREITVRRGPPMRIDLSLPDHQR